MATLDTNPNNQPIVRNGVCHQDFSQPCFGKFVIVYDLDTQNLHFVGDLRPEFVSLLNLPNAPNEQEIMAQLNLATNTLSDREILHKNISLPPEIRKGVIVGGAAAFYDGTKLWADKLSTDFGAISAAALERTLKSTGISFTAGVVVWTGKRIFVDQGPDAIEKAQEG